MADMNKLASQIPGVLQEASQHMRKIANANADLVRENEELRHELRLTKLARRMEERGLEPSLDYEAKLASLQDIDVSRLDALEQAVELAAGGFTLGRLDAGDGDTKVAGGTRHDDLDTFVLSHQAYS